MAKKSSEIDLQLRGPRTTNLHRSEILGITPLEQDTHSEDKLFGGSSPRQLVEQADRDNPLILTSPRSNNEGATHLLHQEPTEDDF